jgi:uncharacterized membrane protein
MTKWLRRRLIAGLFAMVPLAASLVVLIWLFRQVDGLASGLSERLLGRYVPGLGILATAVIVLLVGTLATNMVGRRVLQQGEALLMHVPVFRAIYGPLKQLTAAFSPDNEFGFKRVVLLEEPSRGWVLGFLTREFVVDRGHGPETLLAVYLPTNQLYLGDIVICPRERASFPDLTVEQGVRIFLTGGVGLPARLDVAPGPPGPPTS